MAGVKGKDYWFSYPNSGWVDKIPEFTIPDYLQSSLDKTSDQSLVGKRKSAATLSTTLGALTGMESQKENFAATGLSGGFQDKAISRTTDRASISLQNILTDETRKMEQEKISLEREISQLESDYYKRATDAYYQGQMTAMQLQAVKDRDSFWNRVFRDLGDIL